MPGQGLESRDRSLGFTLKSDRERTDVCMRGQIVYKKADACRKHNDTYIRTHPGHNLYVKNNNILVTHIVTSVWVLCWVEEGRAGRGRLILRLPAYQGLASY